MAGLHGAGHPELRVRSTSSPDAAIADVHPDGARRRASAGAWADRGSLGGHVNAAGAGQAGCLDETRTGSHRGHEDSTAAATAGRAGRQQTTCLLTAGTWASRSATSASRPARTTASRDVSRRRWAPVDAPPSRAAAAGDLRRRRPPSTSVTPDAGDPGLRRVEEPASAGSMPTPAVSALGVAPAAGAVATTTCGRLAAVATRRRVQHAADRADSESRPPAMSAGGRVAAAASVGRLHRARCSAERTGVPADRPGAWR